MAAVANTFLSTNAKGNRESISDVVSRITPEDTPIYTMIDKDTDDSVHPEWEIDTLAAPGANVQTEGDEYIFGAITPPSRVGNYMQIMRKEFIISNTQQAVKNVGQVEKLRYQKLKKGVEIKKDVEYSIISNVASVGGATRVSGGLPSWIATNASRGAGGANGGFNTGTGLTVPETLGTQRAFTKAVLDSTTSAVYSAGGNLRSIVCSPYVKSTFVSFMSDPSVATFRYAVGNEGKRTAISNVEAYEGPFGEVEVVTDRVMATNAGVARRAFLIDPDMLAWSWLRKIMEDPDIAKTGDAKKVVIIGEGCLKPKNEAAHGVVADLFGLSAAT